jgi:chloramphenicol 3-O-phosphotransferase
MILVFEGPDMVGKTSIARALSAKTGTPYFKRSGETDAFARSPDPQTFFYNTLVYAGTFLADFLEQVRPAVIMDRSYPSERVYATVYGRETDEALHETLDQTYHRAGAGFVLCLRHSYEGLVDPDSGDRIRPDLMEVTHRLYEAWARWTRCPVLVLYTDDQDLPGQLAKIEQFMKECRQ